MNVFYVLDARYTDGGGEGGVPALTGSDTTLVFRKKREAEFQTASQGTTRLPSRDVEGGGSVITGKDGAWSSYDPFNLHQISALSLRVSAAQAGTVELRRDAPDGELLATASVPETGLGTFTDVRVDVADPGESFDPVRRVPRCGRASPELHRGARQGHLGHDPSRGRRDRS